MKLDYLEVTTIRPIFYNRLLNKKRVNFQGVEIIAKTPTGSKINVVSETLFTMPLLDYDKQMSELVKSAYSALILEHKKLELFYKNINI